MRAEMEELPPLGVYGPISRRHANWLARRYLCEACGVLTTAELLGVYFETADDRAYGDLASCTWCDRVVEEVRAQPEDPPFTIVMRGSRTAALEID